MRLEQGQQTKYNHGNILWRTSYCFRTVLMWDVKESVTLAVSNLRAVFAISDEDPEEFSLALDGLWAVPHQRAMGGERTFCGTDQINDMSILFLYSTITYY